jgi:hypothetical protein
MRTSKPTILKFDVKNGECRLDSTGSQCGPVAGSCEQGNKALGFIKGRAF